MPVATPIKLLSASASGVNFSDPKKASKLRSPILTRLASPIAILRAALRATVPMVRSKFLTPASRV